MRLTYEPTEAEKREHTFLTLSSFERDRMWKIDREELPHECLHAGPYRIIRLGTPVVMKLPAGPCYPQEVMLPTGHYAGDVFVGFVITDQRSLNETFSSVDVGGGHFLTQTPQFDPEAEFKLREPVYANSRGLVSPYMEGVRVGRVISLPTEDHPFLGIVGTTEG